MKTIIDGYQCKLLDKKFNMKKLILIIMLVFVFTACETETAQMQQFRGKTVTRITESAYSCTIEFNDGTSIELWSNNVIFTNINKK